MSHHLSLTAPATVAPNPSFFAWLRHHAVLFAGQIVGLISAVASFIYYIEGAYEKTELKDLNHHLKLWSDCAHLVFIFLFICLLIYVLDNNDRGRYHARRVQERVFNERLSPDERETLLNAGQSQVARFKRYFLSFWVLMFLLYLAFLGKHLAPSADREIRTITDIITTSAFPFLTFALNNISVWCIFLCFTVLYLPADDEQSVRKRNRMIRFSVFALSILVLLFPLVILSESFRIISGGGCDSGELLHLF